MLERLSGFILFSWLLACNSWASAEESPTIEIRADKVLHPASRHLTGSCIEDVNHEIYGGLYSQILFGESFQEPPSSGQIEGFGALGGVWRVTGNEVHASGEQGDKLVSDTKPFVDGEIGVEVFVPDRKHTNAGLIVRVGRAQRGADNFDGYEISLNAEKQEVLLGRHQQDWRPLRTAPCKVPTGEWVSLVVRLAGSKMTVLVDGAEVCTFDDGQAALPAGSVGLRKWQPEARFRNLYFTTAGKTTKLPFQQADNGQTDVSGMWTAVATGTAKGSYAIETEGPFVGRQSQRLTYTGGEGSIGLTNEGLNRWGLHFEKGKEYEGLLCVRSEAAATLTVAIETRDGSEVLAKEELKLSPGDWQRLPFKLKPSQSADGARFTISLREPGSVLLGYAMLQPGDWGRFEGLPVRRDVAEGLQKQGVTLLRYGGSMVNNDEYRWKKMIGPREDRPPYRGHWYPYSTNGWGIVDFLAFCEAADFEAVPAFNMGETPADMADFIRYCKAPADTEWGRRRAADGHRQPFALPYMQLGNEERIDDAYFEKFKAIAEAIWAEDAQIKLVCGDFVYTEPIRDPFNFRGTVSGITSVAAHQKILQLAKQQDREVWFDLHVTTDGPRYDATVPAALSMIDALEKVADGAKFKVVIFELNSGNHTQRRALANAAAIQTFERDGRVPIALAANALQPDGQNDNGWDQGLLFLNPAQVWLQPPGYVTQMFSQHYLPQIVDCRVSEAAAELDVVAKRSDDGRQVQLQVVNPTDHELKAELLLAGFTPTKPTGKRVELSGPLTARNTAGQPTAIVPAEKPWEHRLQSGRGEYTFPANSVTVLRLE